MQKKNQSSRIQNNSQNNSQNKINPNKLLKKYIGLFAITAIGLGLFGSLSLSLAPAVFADSAAPAVPAGSAASGSAPVASAPIPAGSPGQALAPAAPQQPGFAGMVMPFALMFGVLYLFMIRPQQKKAKDHQNVLSALSHGDDVVTSSGLLGKVTGITDKVVTLEIADNVRVKMLKSQVSQVVKGQQIKEL